MRKVSSLQEQGIPFPRLNSRGRDVTIKACPRVSGGENRSSVIWALHAVLHTVQSMQCMHAVHVPVKRFMRSGSAAAGAAIVSHPILEAPHLDAQGDAQLWVAARHRPQHDASPPVCTKAQQWGRSGWGGSKGAAGAFKGNHARRKAGVAVSSSARQHAQHVKQLASGRERPRLPCTHILAPRRGGQCTRGLA